ncbi:30S ribosomal protein S6p [Chitinispirillum alkaliphilum]|nr:30S ribosomal protein S6p [Chitinispirillum alkaliphilum]
MKRPYESVIVFDGTLSDDTIQREQKQIEEFLSANADFEKADVWGKKALAYPIKKKRSGYYVLYLYEGEGNVPAALDKHIKLNESVLRSLTVLRDLKNEAARAAVVARKEQKTEAPVKKSEESSESESDKE